MPISAPKIPEGLPELMRGLAKSVIKENPENLYVHAAEYFENLIRERDGELERGYQTFNAYQVYADYKEKTREQLGLTKADTGSVSDGDDGDESGSGGSGTKSRGRRRARRARKQPPKDNPPTMVEKASPTGGGQKQDTFSEESAPLPVVEQEVVKVHYNPPEASPTSAARVVSAQSVEAEQAVSTVLDDDLMLDSDGAGTGKVTGDELVDRGDDVGTAPSTAEISGPCAEAAAVHDMETCFMHANVEDLLEKSPEDVDTVVGNGSEVGVSETNMTTTEGEDIPKGPQVDGAGETPLPQDAPEAEIKEEGNNLGSELKIPDTTEGEDIPEGPQVDGDCEKTLTLETGPVQQDAPEAAVKEDENQLDSGEGQKIMSDEVKANDDAPPAKEAEQEPVSEVESAAAIVEEKPIDEPMESTSKSTESEPSKADTSDQERPKSSEKIDVDAAEPSLDTVSSDVVVEPENKNAIPSAESQEEVKITSPSKEESSKEASTESSAEPGVMPASECVAPEEIISEPQPTEESVNVTSRMGLDAEEDVVAEVDQKVESTAGGEEADDVDKSNEEGSAQILDEKSSNLSEEDASLPQTKQDSSERESKAEVGAVETLEERDLVEKNEAVLADANNPSLPDQGGTEDASIEKGDVLESSGQSTEDVPAADEQSVIKVEKDSIDEPEGVTEEKKAPSNADEKSSNLESVEETVEKVPGVSLVSAASERIETVPEVPVAEESEASNEPDAKDSSLEKEDIKDENDSTVLSSALETDVRDANEPLVSPSTGTVENVSVDKNEADEAAQQDTSLGVEVNEAVSANGEELLEKNDKNEDEPRQQSVEEKEVKDDPAQEESTPEKTDPPVVDRSVEDSGNGDAPVQPSSNDQNQPLDEAIEGLTSEAKPEEEASKEEKASLSRVSSQETKAATPAEETQKDELPSSEKGIDREESVAEKHTGPPGDDKEAEKLVSDEVLTLQSVVMDTLPEFLKADSGDGDRSAKGSTEQSDSKGSTDNEKVAAMEEQSKDLEESSQVDKEEPSPAKAEPEQRPEGDDVIKGSTTSVEEQTEESPLGENLETVADLPDATVSESVVDVAPENTDVQQEGLKEVSEEPCIKREKREASMEEVVEEPCIKREVTPTKSTRPSNDDSDEKQVQVEEREEIKKVDLSQLSKDSAEALFYSLKKSELENQDPGEGQGSPKEQAAGSQRQESIPDDDDKDVVVAEEPPASPTDAASTKRSFTNDFLDENPITENQPVESAPGSGDGDGSVEPVEAQSSTEAGEREDEFNPMVMVSMRSKQFQEQLHSRGAGGEQSDDPVPSRPVMRRCMTEVAALQRYDTLADDEPTDPVEVEEEDQFDGYYIGHIKNKILASSVSVADSDCFDPTRSMEEPVDENNVRTALETIASTDTESTIASQATIQQVGKRSYLRKHSQNASSNIPYASFGNAAIDKSLDEFIEREEQNKQDEAMAEAATKIQRSYRTHKKRLLRDYHSTMRTFTEDQSAESGEEYASNVIQIKLDQKRAGGPGAPSVGDGGEESDSTMTNLHPQPLGAGRRPMYSLNIDEYDTVARRMTLTRGVALQRNSTPEDDSGKSTNASTDRKSSLGNAGTLESAPPSGSGSGDGQTAPTSSEEKLDPKVVAEPSVPEGSSGVQEHKDDHSSSRSRPHRTGSASTVRDQLEYGPPPKVAGRTPMAQLDVQSLLLIARQRTMPVQIDSSVIRVLPKHMRKRISSAGMLNGGSKRK